MSLGLHSMVISALSLMSNTSNMLQNRVSNSSPLSVDGVPPPMYTVENFSPFIYSFLIRISLHTAFMYGLHRLSCTVE